MKKNVLFFALICFLTTCCLQIGCSNKEYDMNLHGVISLSNQKITSLKVQGVFNFTAINVSKKAKIQGPTNGSASTFNTVTILGPATITTCTCNEIAITGPTHLIESTITGQTIITGPFSAIKSTLQNITITTKEMTLANSSAKSITVEESNKGNLFGFSLGKEQNQIIHLKGKTTITGDITFKTPNGKILTYGDNVSILGNIIGGIIIKKN